jgi:hypothetical protein
MRDIRITDRLKTAFHPESLVIPRPVKIIGGRIGTGSHNNGPGYIRFLDIIVQIEKHKCRIDGFTDKRLERIAIQDDEETGLKPVDVDIRGATHIQFLNGPVKITPFIVMQSGVEDDDFLAREMLGTKYSNKLDRLTLGRETKVRLVHKPAYCSTVKEQTTRKRK